MVLLTNILAWTPPPKKNLILLEQLLWITVLHFPSSLSQQLQSYYHSIEFMKNYSPLSSALAFWVSYSLRCIENSDLSKLTIHKYPDFIQIWDSISWILHYPHYNKLINSNYWSSRFQMSHLRPKFIQISDSTWAFQHNQTRRNRRSRKIAKPLGGA